jgi:hypothetical protein
LTNLQFLLAEQEHRYGNREQPPVPVIPLPYDGPPLRFLLDGRQASFCTTKEEVIYHYQTVPNGRFYPVPEYAARLQGANGASGIVRARINTTGVMLCGLPSGKSVLSCNTYPDQASVCTPAL